jgi:hypothetical protein
MCTELCLTHRTAALSVQAARVSKGKSSGWWLGQNSAGHAAALHTALLWWEPGAGNQ